MMIMVEICAAVQASASRERRRAGMSATNVGASMNDKDRKEMIEPKWMMVGKEEVDHVQVSLLCSTQNLIETGSLTWWKAVYK